MYSVHSEYEVSQQTILGDGGGGGLDDGVRFDWASAAAVARVAEGAYRFARYAQSRSGHTYVVDSHADDRPAERPLFG